MKISKIVKSLKNISLVCVIAFMIASLCAGVSFAADNEVINVGKASLVSGDIQILKADGEWTKLKFNEKVSVGDKIKLPENSKLEVCYNDGNILRVGPNSEIEIALESVKLFNGQTWMRIVKVGSKFEVIAPTFVAGVRGTIFSVAVLKNADKKNAGAVKVWKGVVETKSEKNVQRVTEGLTVNVVENNVSEPAAFNVNAVHEFSENTWQASNADAAYKRYINLLFGGIDPSIKKQIEERKKLPEVIEAYNTYKSFSDDQAIENVINNQ